MHALSTYMTVIHGALLGETSCMPNIQQIHGLKIQANKYNIDTYIIAWCSSSSHVHKIMFACMGVHMTCTWTGTHGAPNVVVTNKTSQQNALHVSSCFKPTSVLKHIRWSTLTSPARLLGCKRNTLHGFRRKMIWPLAGLAPPSFSAVIYTFWAWSSPLDTGVQ